MQKNKRKNGLAGSNIIADSDSYLMGCWQIKSDHLQPMKSLADCHQVQAAVRKWKLLPPSTPKRK